MPGKISEHKISEQLRNTGSGDAQPSQLSENPNLVSTIPDRETIEPGSRSKPAQHHEPQSELKVPPSTQPTIRVGLVLPEDSVPEIIVASISPLSLTPEGAGEKRDPQSTGSFCVKLDSTENNSGLRFAGQTAHSASALAEQPISLSPIPVGRGFHWQTTERFTYPGSIRLSATKNGIEAINEVSFEDYVACVVTSEMGANCPIEFAKAQMIAARSWAYVFMGTKHPGTGYDVCNDDDCQRYQGVTFLSDVVRAASKETAGVYLVDEDALSFRLITPRRAEA